MKKELLKDFYKVNEKEYFRLFKDENRLVYDFEEWKIFYKWVGINKKLNNLFENNPFISKLLYKNKNNIAKIHAHILSYITHNKINATKK